MFFGTSLLENLTVFHKQEDRRTALILVGILGTLGVSVEYPATGCGVLHRLFLLGFCQNLLTDRRDSTPHFLFFIYNLNFRREGSMRQ